MPLYLYKYAERLFPMKRCFLSNILSLLACIGSFHALSQPSNDCPDFRKAKTVRDGKKPREDFSKLVRISRGTNVMKFSVIKMTDLKLEIPAFKQFENNMTDFTADGQEEFKKVVEKIRSYLGANTKGEGVTLEIIGSASQIPTSFDPSKPHNNIKPDGSSIPGKTTVENNKMLALARATELGKKIQAVFPEVTLHVPSLQEIKLGNTVWDENAQTKLNEAVAQKDQKAIESVYAPYQKEQYVMVRTREYKSEYIQPESITSYYININPSVFYMDEGGKYNINRFVVSQTTYDKIGGIRDFESIEQRDDYLKNELKIHVFHKTYAKEEHWMMLTNKESISLREKDDYKKIKGLYKSRVFDVKDKAILEKIIVTDILKNLK